MFVLMISLTKFSKICHFNKYSGTFHSYLFIFATKTCIVYAINKLLNVITHVHSNKERDNRSW